MDPLSRVSFLFFILLAMFFSASETAFSSIPPHKADSLYKQKKPGAKALKEIKDYPDKVLMAILIGSNIANICAAAIATTISIDIANTIWFHQTTIIGIATVLVTIIMLIFGEIIPKTFAINNADKIWLTIAGFYKIAVKILSPIIYLLTWITKKINTNKIKEEISPEEIEAFIELSKNSGAFEEGEYKQIKKMLSFSDITVEEAMTPRIKINAIPDAMSVNEAIDTLLELHHTRIPVYNQSIDDSQKVITLRELVNIKNNSDGEISLKEIALNPIIKLPGPTPIDVALNAFKKSCKHIALVMDEYGGVAGLITLEDVIEEIFGDIQDENDIETAAIRKTQKNTWNVQSFVRIEEFLTESWLSFEEIWIEEEEFSGETLSYLITSILERFPKKGEEIKQEIHLKEGNTNKKGGKADGETQHFLIIKVLEISWDTIGDIQISLE